jgi:hypothetical protein
MPQAQAERKAGQLAALAAQTGEPSCCKPRKLCCTAVRGQGQCGGPGSLTDNRIDACLLLVPPHHLPAALATAAAELAAIVPVFPLLAKVSDSDSEGMPLAEPFPEGEVERSRKGPGVSASRSLCRSQRDMAAAEISHEECLLSFCTWAAPLAVLVRRPRGCHRPPMCHWLPRLVTPIRQAPPQLPL